MSLSDYIYRDLKSKITRGDFNTCLKLPSTRKLKAFYKASIPTVLMAINKLENDGLIEKRLRSGLYIKGAKIDNNKIVISEKNSLPTNISKHIIDNIVNGNFKIGEYLPLQKTLKFQYKTSKSSISKALGILLKDELISKKGSGYIVETGVRINKSNSRNTLYVINSETPFHRQFAIPTIRQFFSSFETELQKYGVTLFENIDLLENIKLFTDTKKPNTAGYFLDLLALIENNIDRKEDIDKFLLRLLEEFKKSDSTLIIDNYSYAVDFYFSNLALNLPKNVFPVVIDQYKLAKKAGTYLASLGHKHIAYFTYGEMPWNMIRFNGLSDGIKKIFSTNTTVTSFNTNFDTTKERHKYIPKFSILDKLKKAFKKSISDIYSCYDFDIDLYEELSANIGLLFYKDHCKKIMNSYFEEALKLKNITAWVCSGETLGVIATEFLKNKKISIPNNLSLLSIGDNEQLMGYGITAVDEQRSLSGYLAAHKILNDLPINKSNSGKINIDGNIIIRKSTRAV